MKVIVLQQPDGSIREVLEGSPYTQNPGERPVAVREIGEQETLPAGLGDYVAAMAKPVALALGLADCAACQTRQIVLNLWKKLGPVKTANLIRRSFTEAPEVIAEELRQWLPKEAGKNSPDAG